MAVDPRSLTIDAKKLMKLTVPQRLDFFRSPQGQSYLASLTPAQRADLFPDYYKRALFSGGGLTGFKPQATSSGGGATATPYTPPIPSGGPSGAATAAVPSGGGGGGTSTTGTQSRLVPSWMKKIQELTKKEQRESDAVAAATSTMNASAYSPQKGGSKMEGGYASSRKGPDGQSVVRTLADYASGRSKHVTLAGNPSEYGKEYIIPKISFYDKSGELKTLTNVRAVVHDTGSAFTKAPSNRFDIPIDKDASNAIMAKNHGLWKEQGVQFGPPKIPQIQPDQTKMSPSDKGTMLFLHGMQSRYGNKSPAQVEAEARRYAAAKGLKFESINVSGDSAQKQREAALARINQGGISQILGFSAGGHNIKHIMKELPDDIKKQIQGVTIVGARNESKIAGVNTEIIGDSPNGHMDSINWLAGQAETQPIPTKVSEAATAAEPGQKEVKIEPRLKGGFPPGLHPAIKGSMLEASKYLPEGYSFRFNNAARTSSTVSGSYHLKRDKNGNALAVDISIIDPNGKVLPNIRSPENFGIYRDFMQNTKKIQDTMFPQFRGRGRWGGYFVKGVPQDLMHYDLGDEMATAAGNWLIGLKKDYAHYGLSSDVGVGMGKSIDEYQLPNAKMVVGVSQLRDGANDVVKNYVDSLPLEERAKAIDVINSAISSGKISMEEINNQATQELQQLNATANVEVVKEGGGIKPIDLTGDFKEVFSPEQGKKVSYGSAEKPEPYKFIGIHHTGPYTLKSALSTAKNSNVGYQIIVDKDGKAYMVQDPDKGRSNHWGGAGNGGNIHPEAKNANSLGISFLGTEKDMTPEARETMMSLVQQYSSKYGIPPQNVLGHGEVSNNKDADEGMQFLKYYRQKNNVTNPNIAPDAKPAIENWNKIVKELNIQPSQPSAAVTPTQEAPVAAKPAENLTINPWNNIKTYGMPTEGVNKLLSPEERKYLAENPNVAQRIADGYNNHPLKSFARPEDIVDKIRENPEYKKAQAEAQAKTEAAPTATPAQQVTPSTEAAPTAVPPKQVAPTSSAEPVKTEAAPTAVPPVQEQTAEPVKEESKATGGTIFAGNDDRYIKIHSGEKVEFTPRHRTSPGELIRQRDDTQYTGEQRAMAVNNSYNSPSPVHNPTQNVPQNLYHDYSREQQITSTMYESSKIFKTPAAERAANRHRFNESPGEYYSQYSTNMKVS